MAVRETVGDAATSASGLTPCAPVMGKASRRRMGSGAAKTHLALGKEILMTAPFPSRVVEDFPSTIALRVVSDTCVAASPVGILTAIILLLLILDNTLAWDGCDHKCVVKDEDREKT